MTALRVANFRRLWLAGLVSDTGDWALLAALPILVYQLTGSTVGTAAAFLVELVPPVLLAPVAGRVADRYERRRTLVVVSLLQAVALTPLLFVHDRSDLAIVYAVIAVESALAAIFDPTKNALLPTLVDADRLVSANSLIGLNQNIGRLVGAPLGGVLLVLGAHATGGLDAIVAVDAASFFAAVALLSRLVSVPAAPKPMHDGDRASPQWRAVLRPRVIRGGLAVIFTSSIAQGLFVVLYVVFVARALHGDAAEIGLLRGVQAVGAIAGGLLLAVVGRIAPGRLTALAATLFGVLDLAIWNAPRLSTAVPIYVVLFIAAGVPGIAMVTGLLTLLQTATSDGQRGTVFAAFGVAASAGQAIGMIGGGLLGDRLGVIAVLNVQGALYLLAGAIASVWLTGRLVGAPIPAAPPATSALVGAEFGADVGVDLRVADGSDAAGPRA
ncbi:MAG TPA: MFS transporter [Micromonosporaceae bacterium]|nr:MFS transporter [Micromonosporaceae bacterium]